MRIVPASDLPDSFFAYPEPPDLGEQVRALLADVQGRGDAALRDLTERFDGVRLEALEVPQEKLAEAAEHLDPATREALEHSIRNVRRFAEVQRKHLQDFDEEIEPGVVVGQRVVPMERVGVYVPGGGYPLVSSLVMGVVPAQVAGVDRIVVCSPPTHEGDVHPTILAAAHLLGLRRVFRLGGVQAIGALAYGTASVPAVDKIVGPGNAYVAQAKKEVFGRVGIDLIAGPTEVLILADETADAKHVAADLLAQAEHDRAAAPLLVTTSRAFAEKVQAEVERQLEKLSTREIARAAVESQGVIVLVESLDEGAAVANRRAPEHLEVQVADPDQIVPKLRNYGSLFVGQHAAEVLGDYAAGLNHTLPTGTTARYRGGLSVLDFLKVQTVLHATAEGASNVAASAAELARAEGLAGHRAAALLRI